MYLLNNRKEEYVEGLTIQKIIDNKKFTYKKKVVYINGDIIKPEKYDTLIKPGDDVKIHHLLAGG